MTTPPTPRGTRRASASEKEVPGNRFNACLQRKPAAIHIYEAAPDGGGWSACSQDNDLFNASDLTFIGAGNVEGDGLLLREAPTDGRPMCRLRRAFFNLPP